MSAEQHAFGTREVVAVDGQTGDDGLTGAQHGGVVGGRRLAGRRRDDLRGELAVNGSAELVHGYSWPSLHGWSKPAYSKRLR